MRSRSTLGGFFSVSRAPFAIFALAVSVRFAFGEDIGDIVARVCLMGCIFFAAGSASVLWRMYWHVPQAPWRSSSRGDTERPLSQRHGRPSIVPCVTGT
jgi:hypothetical protein